MPRAALILAVLSLACVSRADDFSLPDTSGLKMKKSAPAAPAQAGRAAPPGQLQPLQPRSDAAAYLAQTGRKFEAWPAGYYKAPPDDAAKLAKDIELAIDAYQYLNHKNVTYVDAQDHASLRFYLNSGEAKFNPNAAQTAKLDGRLNDLFTGGKVLQVDLLYEALVAADGNVTMALGSLAELFCKHRGSYIPRVADMENADGKNYYRYAGAFIDLHGVLIRKLGEGAAYGNIAGNPIVYAGGEVINWWSNYLRTGQARGGIDTLKTLGPDGNGNLVDKVPELRKGFDAADQVKAAEGWKL